MKFGKDGISVFTSDVDFLKDSPPRMDLSITLSSLLTLARLRAYQMANAG